jgi:zinc transporter ZupT
METLKRFFREYEAFFKGVGTALIIIAIFDWVIAPGLTAKNTLINVFSFLGGSFLILVVGMLIWENLFKTDKKEEKWQDKTTIGQTTKEDNENSTNKENENDNS